MKKALSLALMLVLCLSLTSPAFAYETGSINQAPNTFYISTFEGSVVKEDGSLWTWGYLSNGAYEETPAKVLDDVVSVFDNMAIKKDGSLWMGAYEPQKIMDDVVSVSCSWTTTAVVKTDGSLWMWGRNNYGQFGNGEVDIDYFTTDYTEATKVMDDVVAISTGNDHIAAIKTDGSLWVWGSNKEGQIGNNGVGNDVGGHWSWKHITDENHRVIWSERVLDNAHPIQTIPVKVMDDVVSVSCGYSATAAVKSDGSLWMWGENYAETIGEKSTEKFLTPVKVMDNVKEVCVGLGNVAVIKTDGTLWMWGSNSSGELGNGTFGYNTKRSYKNPVKVMDDVVAISIDGNPSIVALKSDGSFWMWGRDLQGNVTDWGNTAISTTPRKVMDGVALPVSRAVVTEPVLAAVNVTTNGKAVQWTDASPFIDENNRTMVPLRAVGDALGLTVSWDNSKREAIFTNGTKTIYFPIGSSTARTSSGETVAMDTAAVIVDDRTYAPVRYLAEFFGYSIDWDSVTRTVIIK